VRQVAKEILSVSISAHSLFGIVNASQQDDVGDFVYRDLDRGVDTLYAHSVAWDALLAGADFTTSWTAYIVRGRRRPIVRAVVDHSRATRFRRRGNRLA